MTAADLDQVCAALARAVSLAPDADMHAAIAAVSQSLRVPSHVVSDAAGLCGVCARGPHPNDDPLCVPHDDSPMRLRDGTVVNPRAPWPFPAAVEVHA